jgi:hypothetical protein
MDMQERTWVSSHELEELADAVARANYLNGDPSRAYLLDPCCMLEALSDVYSASRRLVRESCQWGQDLAAGTAP